MSHHHHHHHHHHHKDRRGSAERPQRSEPILPTAADFLSGRGDFKYPALANLLINTSAASFVKNKGGNVITVRDTDTFAHCLDILTSNNILSAPVIDMRQHPPRIIGMVDYADLVEFAVQVIEDTKGFGPTSDFHTIMEQSEQLIRAQVIDIIDSSKIDPLYPVMPNDTLATVVEILARRGLHRVVSLNSNHILDGVITQSAVVSFLTENYQCLDTLLDHTVDSIIVRGAPVITVSLNDTAITAFKLIRSNKVSAVAVLNHDGVLVGNISVKDLRLIAPEVSIIPRLYLTIGEFLTKVHRETSAPQHAVVCVPEDTIMTLLQKFCSNRIHRVWVVDHQGRPTGVVSLRDLLLYVFVCASERRGANDMEVC